MPERSSWRFETGRVGLEARMSPTGLSKMSVNGSKAMLWAAATVNPMLVYVSVVDPKTLTLHRPSQNRGGEEDGCKDSLGMHLDSLIWSSWMEQGTGVDQESEAFLYKNPCAYLTN